MGNRQPKLVLRESCITDVTSEWEPGSFLETGAGTGYMTRLFLERGFHGACYDLGKESRHRLRQNLDAYRDRMSVVDDLSGLNEDSFDYLLAFEVLEHIEDDNQALTAWTHFLKPGGKILVSVPAHARKYGKSDEVVGHIRRYERKQLTDLLGNAGYEDIRLWNYGFPLTEFTRCVSNLLISGEREHLALTPVERSTRSSFTRPQYIRRLLGRINEKLFNPFVSLQRVFYDRDYGDGLVATATKC
jgi:SAM-dependent methyltransferase